MEDQTLALSSSLYFLTTILPQATTGKVPKDLEPTIWWSHHTKEAKSLMCVLIMFPIYYLVLH